MVLFFFLTESKQSKIRLNMPDIYLYTIDFTGAHFIRNGYNIDLYISRR